MMKPTIKFKELPDKQRKAALKEVTKFVKKAEEEEVDLNKLVVKGIIGYVVAVVASLAITILSPIGVLWTFIKYAFAAKNFKHYVYLTGSYLYDVGYSLDQTGNVILREPLNDCFKLKGGHEFGDPDETISAALGKNQFLHNLSVVGDAVAWTLDRIDKDHCKKAALHPSNNKAKACESCPVNVHDIGSQGSHLGSKEV